MSPRFWLLSLLMVFPVLSVANVHTVMASEEAIAPQQRSFRIVQTQPAQPNTSILDVTGELQPGDAVLREDNTLYDEYTFEGHAGQRVSIVMESLEFDTYLLLHVKYPRTTRIGNCLPQTIRQRL